MSSTGAFYEFCKVVFIKIREDVEIRSISNKGQKPRIEDFILSTQWNDNELSVEPNPFDAVLFRQIREALEQQIRRTEKKWIFKESEGLRLKPSPIYEIGRRVQHKDHYGINEDLNR